MDLKPAVLAVCAVSAAKCLIGQAAGAAKMKNQIRLMLDVLLALVLITPFVQGFSGFELPQVGVYELADYGYSQELYLQALSEQTAANVEEILAQQLTAAGVGCEKIVADVNISEDNSISITKVTVTTEDFEAAAEIVKNSLGRETEVVNGSSEKTGRSAWQ